MADKLSAKEEKELKNSLTEAEMRQILSQRGLDNLDPNTPRFKIAVFNDVFTRNCIVHKQNIQKSVWTIENIEQQRFRKQMELDSGKITSMLNDNTTMIKEELELEIKNIEWLKDKERYIILQELFSLAQYVGKYDVVKEVVMTEEQYTEFYNSIFERLSKAGVNLLER